MLAPTFTTHLLRCLFKELGSSAKIDFLGVDPLASMPSIEQNSNFAKEYLLYNVSRKRDVYEKKDTPVEIIRSSLLKWTEAEYSCTVVNRHQRYYSPIGEDCAVFSKLDELAATHISRILCDVWPDYKSAGFTGGATNRLPRKYSYAPAKWIGYALPNRDQSVVINAKDHLLAILEENPSYARRLHRKRWQLLDETDCPESSEFDYAKSAVDFFSRDSSRSTAKLDFVPKDTKSVRMIMATGEGTMLCQSVFGAAIRGALADVGIDLNDQNINREWAEIGSSTGVVATVDLSSASDTVSCSLVKQLLPPRWYAWLMSCRDTHVQVDNRHYHELQKIASMGNGYCFELESLIFYGMALACAQYNGDETSFVSVYGDDIIIPSNCYDLLERYFLHKGLFVNDDKTFAGPQGFRESCGGHYYQGQDVTPFYIKENLDSLEQLFHAYNRLHAWSTRVGCPTPKTLKMILDRIPPCDRVAVPSSFGTKSGLHSYVDGIIQPKTSYSLDYQSARTRTRVYRATTADVSERWCERTRLMAWFISAHGPDKDLFSNVRGFKGIDTRVLRECPPQSTIRSKDVSYKWRVSWS